MGKNINGDRLHRVSPGAGEAALYHPRGGGAPATKIAKLVAMITDRVPAKLKGVKGNDPEYWGLADLVSDEMADVALKMGVRKPKTIGQLMKLTKLEREPLQKLLDQMAWVGSLIEYNWENLDGKNPNHEKRYVLPQFVPGSAEFFNMRRSQMDEHPQVAAFFERMTFLPLEKITPMVPPGGAGIGMHVIPVEKAIETENEAVGPGEDLLLAAQIRGQVRQEHVLLPGQPPVSERGLRRRSGKLVHRRGRHGHLYRGNRPGRVHHL